MWAEDEFAQEFAGDGVAAADFEVLDEQDDAGSFVGSADADDEGLRAAELKAATANPGYQRDSGQTAAKQSGRTG